jgi:glycosyltransferase involved in cell wall biosynthesis
VVLDPRVVRGSGGGPDKTILNSPRFLEPAGYRMVCAYLRPPGDPGFAQIRQRAEQKDAPLVEIDDRGPLDWRVVPQAYKVCRRENVRIWHGHDYKSNVLGLILKPFWPMRLVTTVHGWVHHTARTPLYYLVDRLTLRFYEKVICVSDDLHEACLRAGVPPKRCVLLENGIDLSDYRRTMPTAEAKRHYFSSDKNFLVGAAGRLSSEKGFDILVQVVDRLLARGHDMDLVIVGEGDQQADLQGLIDRLGRGDRIRLLGFRPDLRDLYQAFDVFALSSHREGLPNVLLEAMAMEVPVVATRVAGIPKLIAHEENGLLVDAGSVEQMTEALDRLVTDEALRERFRAAGRRTVETRFDFAVRMDKLRRLYDEMSGRNVG